MSTLPDRDPIPGDTHSCDVSKREMLKSAADLVGGRGCPEGDFAPRSPLAFPEAAPQRGYPGSLPLEIANSQVGLARPRTLR